MRVLVTGATGAVGRELCMELLRRGHTLNVLTRSTRDWAQRFPFPCRVWEWDPMQGPAPEEAFADVEGVINLMGESIAGSRWNFQVKKRIEESRVVGTTHLIDGLKQARCNPKVFIGTSAIGIYGACEDRELDENSPVAADFLAEVCRKWEAATALAAAHADRVVILRVGVVLDRLSGMLAKVTPIFQSGIGGTLGSGRQWMSWIHMQDLVRLYVTALEESSLSGTINAVAPEPVTNKEFTTQLAYVLKVPALLPAPRFALFIAAGEMASFILGSQRVLPRVLQQIQFQFEYPSLAAALKEVFADSYRDQEFRIAQWLPASLDQVFEFYSDAYNLEKITPPHLNFHVLDMSTPHIQKGSVLNYRLKLRGIPLRWQTLILEWEPQKKFVDNQTRGPYSRWHHTHWFEEVAGGTLIRDRVWYRLPFGVLGQLAAGWYVRGDVQSIFDHRLKTCAEIFKTDRERT